MTTRKISHILKDKVENLTEEEYKLRQEYNNRYNFNSYYHNNRDHILEQRRLKRGPPKKRGRPRKPVEDKPVKEPKKRGRPPKVNFDRQRGTPLSIQDQNSNPKTDPENIPDPENIEYIILSDSDSE